MLRRANFVAGIGTFIGVLLGGSIVWGSAILVDPRAIGANQDPFQASALHFSYTSTLRQTLNVNAPPPPSGQFAESGHATIDAFLDAVGRPIPDTGLGTEYTLAVPFTDSGRFTLVSFTDSTAVFSSFNLRLIADETTLVGHSAGLIGGDAQISQGAGAFDALVAFRSTGGFFSGNIRKMEVTGTNVSIGGTPTNGAFFTSVHQGEGVLRPIVNPEPAAFVLVGTGFAALAMLRWLRRNDRSSADHPCTTRWGERDDEPAQLCRYATRPRRLHADSRTSPWRFLP